MKKLIRILLMTILVLSLPIQNLQSQATGQKRPSNYHTWVKSMDNSIYKGYLTLLKDSLVTIAKYNGRETKLIKVDDINSIKFRKDSKLVKGMIIGALAGFSIGGIIGLKRGDTPPGFHFFPPLTAEQKALYFGTGLVIPGIIIGGIVCSKKIIIPINGSKENYNSQRAKLEKYKYKY